MINCDLCEQSIHESSAQIRNQYFLCLNCDDNSDKELTWELYKKRDIETLQCDVCCKDVPMDACKVDTKFRTVCDKCHEAYRLALRYTGRTN